MIVEVNRNKDLLGGPTGPSFSTRKVVHNVHLIDASYSMQGGKYENAIRGINMEIETLLKEDTGVDYTMTILEFDNSNRRDSIPVVITDGRGAWVGKHYWMEPLSNVKPIVGFGVDGSTPLYEAAGNVIEKLMEHIRTGEGCVMTILTDGGENSSLGKYRAVMEGYTRKCPALEQLIADAEKKGINVTFSGTQQDTSHVVASLGIHRGNTLVHDNTAAGIGQTFRARSASLRSYSKGVACGQSVNSVSFFVSPEAAGKDDLIDQINQGVAPDPLKAKRRVKPALKNPQ